MRKFLRKFVCTLLVFCLSSSLVFLITFDYGVVRADYTPPVSQWVPVSMGEFASYATWYILFYNYATNQFKIKWRVVAGIQDQKVEWYGIGVRIYYPITDETIASYTTSEILWNSEQDDERILENQVTPDISKTIYIDFAGLARSSTWTEEDEEWWNRAAVVAGVAVLILYAAAIIILAPELLLAPGAVLKAGVALWAAATSVVLMMKDFAKANAKKTRVTSVERHRVYFDESLTLSIGNIPNGSDRVDVIEANPAIGIYESTRVYLRVEASHVSKVEIEIKSQFFDKDHTWKDGGGASKFKAQEVSLINAPQSAITDSVYSLRFEKEVTSADDVLLYLTSHSGRPVWIFEIFVNLDYDTIDTLEDFDNSDYTVTPNILQERIFAKGYMWGAKHWASPDSTPDITSNIFSVTWHQTQIHLPLGRETTEFSLYYSLVLIHSKVQDITNHWTGIIIYPPYQPYSPKGFFGRFATSPGLGGIGQDLSDMRPPAPPNHLLVKIPDLPGPEVVTIVIPQLPQAEDVKVSLAYGFPYRRHTKMIYLPDPAQYPSDFDGVQIYMGSVDKEVHLLATKLNEQFAIELPNSENSAIIIPKLPQAGETTTIQISNPDDGVIITPNMPSALNTLAVNVVDIKKTTYVYSPQNSNSIHLSLLSPSDKTPVRPTGLNDIGVFVDSTLTSTTAKFFSNIDQIRQAPVSQGTLSIPPAASVNPTSGGGLAFSADSSVPEISVSRVSNPGVEILGVELTGHGVIIDYSPSSSADTYNIVVKNTGVEEDTIALEILSKPKNWNASLSSSSMLLQSGETATVTLTLERPLDANVFGSLGINPTGSRMIDDHVPLPHQVFVKTKATTEAGEGTESDVVGIPVQLTASLRLRNKNLAGEVIINEDFILNEQHETLGAPIPAESTFEIYNSTLYLNGNLTLESGYTLRLINTNLIINSSQSNPPNEVYVQAGADLELINSSILSTVSKNKFSLTNDGTLDFTGMVQLRGGAILSRNNITILTATSVIMADSNLSMDSTPSKQLEIRVENGAELNLVNQAISATNSSMPYKIMGNGKLVTYGAVITDNIQYGIRLEPLDGKTRHAELGGMTEYPIRVLNVGTTTDVIDLLVMDIPPGWYATTDVPQVVLDANTSQTILLQVFAPPSSTVRVADITFVANSQMDPPKQETLTTKTTLANTINQMQVEETYKEEIVLNFTGPGENFTYLGIHKDTNVTMATYEISGDLYLGSYPTNPFVDVGGDGMIEWMYTGPFDKAMMMPDFASSLNLYLQTHKGEADENGTISVPIKTHSDSQGRMRKRLIDIRVQFDAPHLNFDVPDISVRDEDPDEGEEDDIHITVFNDGRTASGPFAINITVTNENGESTDTLSDDTGISPLGYRTLTTTFVVTPGNNHIVAELFDPGGLLSTGAIDVGGHSDPRSTTAIVVGDPVPAVQAFTDDIITFDAYDSVDPDGTIIDAEWDLGDGTTANGPIISYSYREDGQYLVTLRVVDDRGRISNNQTIITVLNRPPICSIFATTKYPRMLEDAYFSATDYFDADGNVTAFEWDFGDSTVGFGPEVGHAYTNSGRYNVTLRVFDNDGGVGNATLEIEVLPTTLYVYPEISKVSEGAIFSVNVSIFDVFDLYAFGFKLHYNTTVLDAVDVVIVPFLYEPTLVIRSEIDDALGRVWVAVASIPPVEPRSGSGVLATINFNATLSAGESILELNETELVDYEALPISHQAVRGAVIIYHDLAISNVMPSKNIVGQGYTMSINVTVENRGEFTETFNMTVYCNETAITLPNGKNYTTTTLSSGDMTTITFTWNTIGFAKGNYTISAYAWPVPGETDTADNNLTDGWVIVAMIGDITGPDGWPDGKVDIRDIAKVAKLFGIDRWHPLWDPNCDITGSIVGVPDGKIDIRDIATVAKHFGEMDP